MLMGGPNVPVSSTISSLWSVRFGREDDAVFIGKCPQVLPIHDYGESDRQCSHRNDNCGY